MINDYLAEYLVKEQLDQARRLAARQAMIRQALADRPPLRFRLGTLLIRFGTWLRGGAAEPDVEAKRVTA